MYDLTRDGISQKYAILRWIETILESNGKFIPVEDHLFSVTVTFEHASDPMCANGDMSTFTMKPAHVARVAAASADAAIYDYLREDGLVRLDRHIAECDDAGCVCRAFARSAVSS